MGKFNEIQEQVTQSFGSNSFTTKITDSTVEFDSARDSFTFKDEVNVPSMKMNGTETLPFTAEDKTKLDNLQTPMQIKGRVDSVGDLPTEDVKVGDTYLVGLSGSETFDEYVCTGFAGSPEAPVWESVGSTQVQADWNQTNNTKVDYIKNRPFYDDSAPIANDDMIVPSPYSGNMFFNFSSPMVLNKTYTSILTLSDSTTVEGDATVSSQSGTEITILTPRGSAYYKSSGYTSYGYPNNNGRFSGDSSVIKIKILESNIKTIEQKYLGFSISAGTGEKSIKEGASTNVSSNYASHAEGQDTTASGQCAHAEGYNTTASGQYSHAEGQTSQASGRYSHAEGYSTKATNNYAHAEGQNAQANGYHSHAEGNMTIANRRGQHVFGEYNIEESGSGSSKGTYVEIVGNGEIGTRSNARTLDWSGNEMLAGTLTIGGASGATIKVDSGALKVSFDGGTTWQTVTLS